MKDVRGFFLIGVGGAFATTIIDNLLGIDLILVESVGPLGMILHIVMSMVWGALFYRHAIKK
jgi:hypothetical protein